MKHSDGTEGDEEIQDLLQGSRGLNLGLHFLSGALTFDPVATKVDPNLPHVLSGWMPT